MAGKDSTLLHTIGPLELRIGISTSLLFLAQLPGAGWWTRLGFNGPKFPTGNCLTSQPRCKSIPCGASVTTGGKVPGLMIISSGISVPKTVLLVRSLTFTKPLPRPGALLGLARCYAILESGAYLALSFQGESQEGLVLLLDDLV